MALQWYIYISLLFIIAVIPFCFNVKQIDTDYWWTLLPIPFLTFLFKINTLEYIGVHDIIQKIVFLISTILFITGESLLFPEETSTSKIIARGSLIIGFIFIIYITLLWSSSMFFKSIGLFVIGYCTTSILFKTVFAQEEPAKQSVEQWIV